MSFTIDLESLTFESSKTGIDDLVAFESTDRKVYIEIDAEASIDLVTEYNAEPSTLPLGTVLMEPYFWGLYFRTESGWVNRQGKTQPVEYFDGREWMIVYRPEDANGERK